MISRPCSALLGMDKNPLSCNAAFGEYLVEANGASVAPLRISHFCFSFEFLYVDSQ